MRKTEFDWSVKDKEKYYREAEKLIKGIEGIEIDREQFGVRGENQIAIVHIKKVSIRQQERGIKRLKKIKNFHEVTNRHTGEYGYVAKGIYFDGYFEIEMNGGKKNVHKAEKRSNGTRKCDSMVHVS